MLVLQILLKKSPIEHSCKRKFLAIKVSFAELVYGLFGKEFCNRGRGLSAVI